MMITYTDNTGALKHIYTDRITDTWKYPLSSQHVYDIYVGTIENVFGGTIYDPVLDKITGVNLSFNLAWQRGAYDPVGSPQGQPQQ